MTEKALKYRCRTGLGGWLIVEMNGKSNNLKEGAICANMMPALRPAPRVPAGSESGLNSARPRSPGAEGRLWSLTE